MIYYGIDCGVSGGIAKIDGANVELWSFTEHTIQDMVGLFEMIFKDGLGNVMVERVHAMPSTFRGCSTSWTLAMSYSTILTLLAVHQVTFEQVLPEKWQSAMGCKFPKSVNYALRKKMLRAKAQALFPKVKLISKDVADALLIAEYCRRTHK